MEFVYDRRDRLLFYRDGVLKSNNQRTIYGYDSLNRQISYSVSLDTASRRTMQAAFDVNTNFSPTFTHPYIDQAWITPMLYAYFDKYGNICKDRNKVIDTVMFNERNLPVMSGKNLPTKKNPTFMRPPWKPLPLV